MHQVGSKQRQHPAPVYKAIRCPLPSCPAHSWPAGGCPDPVGHGLRCEFCQHVPVKVEFYYDQDGSGLPMLGIALNCLACGEVSQPEHDIATQLLAAL